MVISSYSNPSGRGQTTQAILMLIVLTVFGAFNLNILGQSITLSLLPLVGICLWPRYAHPVISIVIIFLSGLLLDFLTNENLGFRTLVYLTVFSVFRPDARTKEYIFGTALIRWIGVVLLASIVIYFLSRIGRGVKPDIVSMTRQVLIVTALFPIIYFIRHIFKYFLIDSEDRY